MSENPDQIKYVYHFCAEWMTRARILQRFDGIADMSFRVLTLDDYREVKECVGRAAKDAPNDSTQITILSLSLLGKREVKGGSERWVGKSFHVNQMGAFRGLWCWTARSVTNVMLSISRNM